MTVLSLVLRHLLCNKWLLLLSLSLILNLIARFDKASTRSCGNSLNKRCILHNIRCISRSQLILIIIRPRTPVMESYVFPTVRIDESCGRMTKLVPVSSFAVKFLPFTDSIVTFLRDTSIPLSLLVIDLLLQDSLLVQLFYLIP